MAEIPSFHPAKTAELAQAVASREYRETLPLAGKRVLITGGTHDIGAGTLLTFLAAGADIATIGRRDNPIKRLEEAAKIVQGYPIVVVQGDLTDPKQRDGFCQTALDAFGGSVDIVVLNASGSGRELDVIANHAIVDRMINHMPEGGSILMIPSTPSHWHHKLKGLGKMPNWYGPNVAAPKFEGEQQMIHRKNELDSRGIRFIRTVPTWVRDGMTTNMFLRREPEIYNIHKSFTDILGTPPSMGILDVAERQLQLVTSPDTPSGHIDLFVFGLFDTQELLLPWYRRVDKLLVDTMEQFDSNVGMGRMIVPAYFDRYFDTMTPHQIVEAAAQQAVEALTVATYFPSPNTDALTRTTSRRTGRARLVDHGLELFPGQGLKLYTEVDRVVQNGFRGNVTVIDHASQREVAKIANLKIQIETRLSK